ncbi:macrophage infectivity potentiator [Isoalcanivorax pacificus W11-5]|uniref:Peptidyl-prolyl cis-trans isomerase n=1 Tax=Isoalcanivorax pacificus W11-5 TaxID=391936 RepID=A0A0B4XRC3_9GAMM|nr:FKBP-type peptidyl-prolyl cis-trans isomerase [Isoalcanivorax pacificus]AJD48953.1 macrophage infectivity potentiator [Isoalcanivorax pacificus W11-5]
MKHLAIIASILSISGCASQAPQEVDTSSSSDVTAYSFGIEAGKTVKAGLEDKYIDKDLFLLGVHDAIKGNNLRYSLTPEEISAAHNEHNIWATEKKEEEALIAGEKNAQEGSSFIESYSSREGVRSLDSGILYTVLSAGDGASHPTAEDTVEVHYEGRLIDGTVFDSSVERGEPVSIELERVIEGWREAITHMSEGDKWEVVIPSRLAYGTQGRPPAIEPNKTLIFQIELLKIAEEG